MLKTYAYDLCRAKGLELAFYLPSTMQKIEVIKRPFPLFLLLGVVLLACSVALMIGRSDHRARVEESEKVKATERAGEAAKAIDAILQETERAGEAVVASLDSGLITANDAPAVIKATLEEHPAFWGFGIVYDPRQPSAPFTGDSFYTRPQAFTGNNFYTRPGGVITEGNIPYDYTDAREPRAHWWLHAFETGPGWIPPYLGGTSGRLVTLYTAPFYGPNPPANGLPAGVILVSLRLDAMNRSVGWSELAADGYGMVVSRSGSYASHPTAGKNGGFIAHPVKTYWRGSSIPSNFYAAPTFPDVIRETGNTEALKILGPLEEGGQTFLDYEDEVTDQDAWLFYELIPTADWVLGYVLPKSVALAGDRSDFHYQIWIGLTFIAGVSSLVAAAFVRMFRNGLRLWALVGVMTLAPLIAIGLIWSLVVEKETRASLDADGVSLRRAVDRYEEYVTSVSPSLKSQTVLAGVFLDAIEQNENGRDWDIAGIVWQQYLNGVPEGVEPGFVLPDAVTPAVFEHSHDVQSGSSRTIGWRFSATIRPHFDHAKYPIDDVLLTVRFAHRQIDRPLILLPDVGEYDLIMPSSRPGLASSLTIGGFEIRESYFGYESSELNSTLGIPDFARQADTPEMTFNVRLSRQFLDPFVSQMLPLIVVVALLFAVHLMSTRPGEWTVQAAPTEVPRGMQQRTWRVLLGLGGDVEDDSGRIAHSVYYTQATLTTVLALMFVSIFSHNGLRSALSASEIIYLEYAYFVVYASLLLVAINSLLFAAGLGGILVQWRHNLIPELAYWPLVATAMFIATLRVFY